MVHGQLTCPHPVAEPVRRGGKHGCERVETVPRSAFFVQARYTDAAAEAEIGKHRSRMSTVSTAALIAVLSAGSTRSGGSMPNGPGVAQ